MSNKVRLTGYIIYKEAEQRIHDIHNLTDDEIVKMGLDADFLSYALEQGRLPSPVKDALDKELIPNMIERLEAAPINDKISLTASTREAKFRVDVVRGDVMMRPPVSKDVDSRACRFYRSGDYNVCFLASERH